MIWKYLVVFLVGLLGGYILKDQTTEEFKTDVRIHKPKVKKGGNMDLDQMVDVNMKKLSLRERIKARRDRKRNS